MWNGPTSNIDSMHIPNPMNTTVQVKFRLKTIHQLLHLTQSKRMSCDANTRTSPSGIILQPYRQSTGCLKLTYIKRYYFSPVRGIKKSTELVKNRVHGCVKSEGVFGTLKPITSLCFFARRRFVGCRTETAKLVKQPKQITPIRAILGKLYPSITIRPRATLSICITQQRSNNYFKLSLSQLNDFFSRIMREESDPPPHLIPKTPAGRTNKQEARKSFYSSTIIATIQIKRPETKESNKSTNHPNQNNHIFYFHSAALPRQPNNRTSTIFMVAGYIFWSRPRVADETLSPWCRFRTIDTLSPAWIVLL